MKTKIKSIIKTSMIATGLSLLAVLPAQAQLTDMTTMPDRISINGNIISRLYGVTLERHLEWMDEINARYIELDGKLYTGTDFFNTYVGNRFSFYRIRDFSGGYRRDTDVIRVAWHPDYAYRANSIVALIPNQVVTSSETATTNHMVEPSTPNVQNTLTTDHFYFLSEHFTREEFRERFANSDLGIGEERVKFYEFLFGSRYRNDNGDLASFQRRLGQVENIQAARGGISSQIHLDNIDEQFIRDVQFYFVQMLNEHRSNNNRASLTLSSGMSIPAQQRIDSILSQGFVRNNVTSREVHSFGNGDVIDYIRTADARSANFYSGIIRKNAYDTARNLHQWNINSFGHQENELNINFSHVGVGLAQNIDGTRIYAYLFFR